MRYFILLLLIFPFIEIYSLIVIGNNIGAFNSILWIILTGVMGIYLLRNQGLSTLMEIRSNKPSFESTADNFLKTIFTPIGGFFLLVPGFISDLIGILILLPISRIFILGLLFKYLMPFNQAKGRDSDNDDWIEGEFKKDK
tara:strand:- start:120 stop:542 length:423 start_codon:yes stop_codon:yes gene_type:complete